MSAELDVLLVRTDVMDLPFHPILLEFEAAVADLAATHDQEGISFSYLDPPVALIFIATALVRAGFSVEILDLTLERNKPEYSFEISIAKALARKPKVIGISYMEECFEPQVRRIAAICRDIAPRAGIVLGGIAAAAIGDELVRDSLADHIVTGEGEARMMALCEKLIRGNSAEASRPRLHAEEIPIPNRDLYASSAMYELNSFVDVVYCSRGCPHSCAFCNAPGFWRRQWVGRAIPDILAELRDLVARGVRKLHVYDLNISSNNRWFESLLHAIIDARLDLRWDTEIRTEVLYNSELVQLMAAAGCREAFIGVESYNIENLPGTGKQLELRQLADGLNNAKRNGLLIAPGIIIGLPDETEEMICANVERTLALTGENTLYFPQFELYMPWRGTAIGESRGEHGITMLTDRHDWMHFYPPGPVCSTRHVSGERIFEIFLDATTRVIPILREKARLRREGNR